MKELDHLKSMWSHKVKRKTDLIVPKITYSDTTGSLNNEVWEYKVPFAFRDALDIKYEQRMKDKKPYMVWTQGPILNFKNGDLLTDKNNKKAVQVLFANRMGWDTINDKMYEGSIVYDTFKITNGEYIKEPQQKCSQMQFLALLIYGTSHC